MKYEMITQEQNCVTQIKKCLCQVFPKANFVFSVECPREGAPSSALPILKIRWDYSPQKIGHIIDMYNFCDYDDKIKLFDIDAKCNFPSSTKEKELGRLYRVD